MYAIRSYYAAAFCGDYLRMDELLSLVLFYGDDIEIIAKAHRIRISALVSQNKPQMAIDESFVLLALLNVSLPQKPSVFRVMASFANTSRLLKKQPVNSLDQLPLMTDQNTLIAMDVLGALISILYRVNPYLLARITSYNVCYTKLLRVRVSNCVLIEAISCSISTI